MRSPTRYSYKIREHEPRFQRRDRVIRQVTFPFCPSQNKQCDKPHVAYNTIIFTKRLAEFKAFHRSPRPMSRDSSARCIVLHPAITSVESVEYHLPGIIIPTFILYLAVHSQVYTVRKYKLNIN